MKNNKPNRPTIKNSSLVWENEVFRLFADEVDFNDNHSVKDYLRVVPKSGLPDFAGGVTVLPVIEGKIGLIEHHRHIIGQDVWEAPRGFIDKSETSDEAAKRELEEETGYICDSMKSLGTMAPEAGVIAARIYLFVAPDCVKVDDFNPNEIGHLGFELFTTGKVEKMIDAGEILDPGTMVIFYKALKLALLI